MAQLTQISTSTLSNQNIASALLVHTFTNTTRLRKIYIDVFADQLAGNGNYVVYATRQRSGAGSAYEMGARTTVAVPSGVTAQHFPTIALMVGATDVVKVYVVGLAGDTTTPDIITDVSEEFISADASGRVNVGQWLDGAVPTPNVTGVPIIDLKYILGTVLTETAGQIAAGFKKLFDVASPVFTLLSIVQTGDSYARIGAAGAGLTALGDTRVANLDATVSSRAAASALATLQGNVTTILADYARRTGDYATVAALATLQGNVTSILADYARRTGDYSTLTAAQVDTLLTTNHGAGSWGAGGNGGALTLTYTLTSTAGAAPIEGALVELYSDIGMTTLISAGITNVFGVVTFSNLLAGTYYLKRIKSGYTFTNPDSEVVA